MWSVAQGTRFLGRSSVSCRPLLTMDHFEYVAIQGIPKEESIERGRSEGFHQFPAMRSDSVSQREHVLSIVKNRQVPSEFIFEWRHGKIFQLNDVDLLGSILLCGDIDPCDTGGCVTGNAHQFPTHGVTEKLSRGPGIS